MGDTRTDNPGRDDCWTCPSCLKDLAVKFPTTCTCPCGARLQLRRETQPVCVAIVIGSEEDGECDNCGDKHFSPSLEAFERFGRVLCEECAEAAHEEAAEHEDDSAVGLG